MDSLGVELTFPEMERLTMYLDPEHRGRINYQEFANAVLGDGGETAAIAPSAQRSPVSSTGASRMDLAMRREISDRLEAKSSKLSSVFRLMDTDSSGLLTKDQFRDGMTTIGMSHEKILLLSSCFLESDTCASFDHHLFSCFD